MANLWLPPNSSVARAARGVERKGLATLLRGDSRVLAHWDFTQGPQSSTDIVNGYTLTWTGNPIWTSDGVYLDGSTYGKNTAMASTQLPLGFQTAAVVNNYIPQFALIAGFMNRGDDLWWGLFSDSEGFNTYDFQPGSGQQAFSGDVDLGKRRGASSRHAASTLRQCITEFMVGGNSNFTASPNLSKDFFIVGARDRTSGLSAYFTGTIESITVYDERFGPGFSQEVIRIFGQIKRSDDSANQSPYYLKIDDIPVVEVPTLSNIAATSVTASSVIPQIDLDFPP